MDKQLQSIIPNEAVVDKIYNIREQKVMLDSDLALLYGIDTKRINEQVKRNIDRFPEDFMFQLTEYEFQNLKSQIATSSWGGRRTLPYAFTEHGVLMLSSVLNSKKAIQVNIQIMRIFNYFRKMLSDNANIVMELEKLKKSIRNQDQNIEVIFKYLDELSEKQSTSKNRRRIGYMQDDL